MWWLWQELSLLMNPGAPLCGIKQEVPRVAGCGGWLLSCSPVRKRGPVQAPCRAWKPWLRSGVRPWRKTLVSIALTQLVSLP